MKNHYEVFDIYLVFLTMVKTQDNFLIKFFICNLCVEYTYNNISELITYASTITRYLILILLNKIELLKEYIVTLLKLHIPFYYLLWFSMIFRVKQFLQSFKLLIESHCLSHNIVSFQKKIV